MTFKTKRYPSGRPLSDVKPDILSRVVKKHLPEKRRDPRSIIALYQDALAKETGTTRTTLSKAFEQYEGIDLKVLDPSFEGLKIFKAPTAYVLDDDLGELLLIPWEGVLMGLCTSCGEWMEIPIQMPWKITCNGCGLVYEWAYDRNLNLNNECSVSPLLPFLVGMTLFAVCT